MTRTNQSGILDIASQIYTAQAGWSVRGTSNKYTPRDTEFVVIWHDARKMGARCSEITFSSRADAHWYAKGEPHTVKPINSLAAQGAR